jgi:hypothetical protein|tara:strand:+ start:1301 stop:1501 length:201 start_codon:yes stop_codon:yes gene_type:complete
MSFTYIVEIKQNRTLVDSTTTDNLSKAVSYAEKNSLVGDLVVVSEGYTASDGVVEVNDHINSWYVD